MRNDLKSIALKRYTWEIIAHKYKLLIDEALYSSKKLSIYGEINQLDDDLLQEYQIAHLKNNEMFYEKR